MFNNIVVSFVIGYFILIWLRTNAFAEYMLLCRQSYFFKLKEYSNLHKEGYDGNYVDFLVEYYKDVFLVRLISCPVCLSFWLGLMFCLITGQSTDFIIAPLSLLFYLLFNRLL
jgi:hypothetical protein